MRVYNLTDVGPREDLLVYKRVVLRPGQFGEVPGFLRTDPKLQKWERDRKLAFEELPDWYLVKKGQKPAYQFEFDADAVVRDLRAAIGHITPYPNTPLAEIFAADPLASTAEPTVDPAVLRRVGQVMADQVRAGLARESIGAPPDKGQKPRKKKA